MKKSKWLNAGCINCCHSGKIFLKMKLTIMFIMAGIIQVAAINSYSQTTRLTFELKSASVADVLKEIENQSEFYFAYNKDAINLDRKLDLTAKNLLVEEILDQLFRETNVKYKITDRHIILSTLELVEPQKSVSGKVTDSSGQSLPGVSVVVKGTTLGVITDVYGKYSISSVPENATLIFSFVGMKTQEIAVGAKTTINVTLADETIGIEEVVAIGYGTQKRSDVTGAIGSVKNEALVKVASSSVEQMMQGRLAGISVVQTSGAPGAISQVRIRGVGTLNNSNPLYVIDGIPGGNINNIPPQDIASIEVLKDASSSAIYGSQAANGVILVTTKKVTKGAPSFVFEAYTGIDKMSNKIKMLNAVEYINYIEEGFTNDGSTLAAKLPVYVTTRNDIQSGKSTPEGTDWVDVITNDKAMTKNYYFGVSGGNDFSTYNISVSYFNQDGIIQNSSYERLISRLSSTYKLGKNASLGLNASFTTSKTQSINDSQDQASSVFGNATVYDPSVPIIDPTTGLPSMTRHQNVNPKNPLGSMVLSKDDWSKTNDLSINPYFKWEIFKGLTYNANFAYGSSHPRNFDINPKYYNATNDYNSTSTIGEIFINNWSLYWDNSLSYTKTIDNHSFTAMLGMSAGKSFHERIYGQRSNLPGNGDDPTLWSLDNAKDFVSLEAEAGGYSPNYSTRASYFGRINYNWKEKYLLQATMRRDGSSNLGPDNRWGNFPSASVAWRISQEGFMKNTKWLSNLKFRAGYGVLGNDNIGVYSYATTINTTYVGYLFGPQVFASPAGYVPGSQISSTGNSALKWESTAQLNAGFDFGIWKDILTGSFDIYKRETSDILVGLPVSGVSGLATNPVVNGGGMVNKGIEISLAVQNKIGDLAYNISANFSTNNNEVTSLGYGKQPIYSNLRPSSAYFSKTEVGNPIASFWGLRTNGLFQTLADVQSHVGPTGAMIQPNAKPGDLRYVDQNNDGKINDADKTYLGSPTPKYNYGLSIDLTYKNFDFSVFFNGASGFELINLATKGLNQIGYRNVAQKEYDSRWHGEGTSNKVPRISWLDPNSNLANNSDEFIEDGSFLRLRDIQLGYSFLHPEYIKIKNLRVYASVKNLLTLTKFSGTDPEMGQVGGNLDIGVAQAVYPKTRTFLLGVSLKF